jgi:hypothetical protein
MNMSYMGAPAAPAPAPAPGAGAGVGAAIDDNSLLVSFDEDPTTQHISL